MKLLVRQLMTTGASLGLAMLMVVAARGQDQAAGANGTAQAQHTIQLVQAQATLAITLDTKKAKQGEPVTAKLEENVPIPGEQALPRNTVLEGHVDQVQPSEHKSDSMVVVTFDKAKLKDGQELPIKATILAVSEPALAQEQASAGAPASMGEPMPSGSPGGSGSRGGSMASSPSVPSTPAPQPMNVPASGSQQQTQQKGVPDVTLQSDIHQHSSATFTSKGRNVHVPDGTQMQVALAVIPPGVTLQ